MGHGKSTQKGMDEVKARVEARTGKIQLTGRYHRLPRTLEDDYLVEQVSLGTGYNSHENGPVRRAKGIKDGMQYAVKSFKLHALSKEKQLELQTEVEIFLSLDHPHIARLTDAYEGQEWLRLVMECMEGGELFDRVTELKVFSEKDAADTVYQMLLAVNYLHSHEVVHRDIKLENFLYEKKGGTHLKLIDFGFSKVWEKRTKMELSCGTLSYVAPEVLARSYTNKCDMWSLGVVVFILLSGYMPFSGSEEMQIQLIRKGKYNVRQDRWKKVSKTAQNFVSHLLKVDSEQRLSAQQALEHEWIAKREHHDHDELDAGMVTALKDFGHASRFRRACMSMMAWSLSVEERQKVRGIFLELDTTKTGTITMGDLKSVLTTQFHVPDEEIKEIFHAMDSNHDETIHYSDFLAAMLAGRVAMHDDLIYQAFRRFDTDNTGKMTVENLKEVLGDSFEGEKVEEIMAEIPHEGGEIDYIHFLDYLKHPDCSEDHHEIANSIIDSEWKKGNGKEKAESHGRQTIAVAQSEKVDKVVKKESSGNVKSAKSCVVQ